MNKVPLSEAWPVLIPVALLLLGQGTWLFLDARQRGARAWFWGLWGFIQFPMPTVVYLLLLWWKERKNRHEHDNNQATNDKEE